MAEMGHLEADTKVAVDVNNEGLVVKSAVEKLGALQFPYSENEMLAGIGPDNAHADILAEPKGPELGA
ncbi:MAG: hypothetical protein OXH52_09410 [Gammaproteobacteria bacterium]|nr:hypothetical protein [Gammaproteobacteria bacterium]